jgi:hypothetical protein
MTVLSGALKHSWLDMRKTRKDRKSHRPPLSSGVACGRKAPKSICQQASPGFPRPRSGQALRLRAIKTAVYDRSAKRFAQDDGFVGGLETQLVGYAENTKRSKKSQTPLSSGVACGRKARKSICQQASPGFPRLRSGQALRLRAIKPSVYDRSAKRFAQDDDFRGP